MTETMSFDYDLFVIGGGSGGVRAARVAAQTGAKVALAEEDRYGGTCVIRGCVPKKLMVFASEYPNHMADAQAYGWTVHAGGFDWEAFKTKLHTELDRLEGVYRSLLKNSGVDTYDARAILKTRIPSSCRAAKASPPSISSWPRVAAP
jgi:glutathione reductase (NADPH)